MFTIQLPGQKHERKFVRETISATGMKLYHAEKADGKLFCLLEGNPAETNSLLREGRPMGIILDYKNRLVSPIVNFTIKQEKPFLLDKTKVFFYKKGPFQM